MSQWLFSPRPVSTSSPRFGQLQQSSLELIEDLQPGQEISGTVTQISDAGAILDLGLPLPGFLHKSKICEQYIANVNDMLSVGETVTGRIREIRTYAQRDGRKPAEIEISMVDVPEFNEKLLDELQANFKLGQEVSGTVTKVLESGAVLDLGLVLPGFVHISKISENHIEKVSDALSVGDTITANVLEIRTKRETNRRAEVEVTMIDVPEINQVDEIHVGVEVGQEVIGTVTELRKVGAMLDLGLSVPGFLHLNQISGDRVKSKQVSDLFTIGEKVTTRVTEIRGIFRGRPPEIVVSMIA